MLTKPYIQKAIKKFEKGERPFRFTKPRAWYVIGSRKRLYPLKYIYALATGRSPSSFNTSESKKALKSLGFKVIPRPKDHTASFEAKVHAAIRDPVARADRLRNAAPKPMQHLVQVVEYERNPDVVAEVLSRANGICEVCEKKAPFSRRKDGSPYLEVHHKVQLADGGDDTVKNAIAACPNCHRKAHYG